MFGGHRKEVVVEEYHENFIGELKPFDPREDGREGDVQDVLLGEGERTFDLVFLGLLFIWLPLKGEFVKLPFAQDRMEGESHDF